MRLLRKKRVLLIDVDPQGSASSWLGFRNPSKGLFTLFTENGSIADFVSKTSIDGLDIVQSSAWLVNGILACRTNKRTRLAQDILSDLRKRFNEQVYETTIREGVKLVEAPSFGKPITLYGTRSSGAEDYRSLATEIIKRRKGK